MEEKDAEGSGRRYERDEVRSTYVEPFFGRRDSSLLPRICYNLISTSRYAFHRLNNPLLLLLSVISVWPDCQIHQSYPPSLDLLIVRRALCYLV